MTADTIAEGFVIPLYAIRGRRKGYEVSTMKALMDMAGLAEAVRRRSSTSLREKQELRAILETWGRFWID
jgi:hypothetical protein